MKGAAKIHLYIFKTNRYGAVEKNINPIRADFRLYLLHSKTFIFNTLDEAFAMLKNVIPLTENRERAGSIFS